MATAVVKSRYAFKHSHTLKSDSRDRGQISILRSRANILPSLGAWLRSFVSSPSPTTILPAPRHTLQPAPLI